MKETSLLAKINTPEELRALGDAQMAELASELREYITGTVLKNGGHLASNLGVIELTLAIHRVFDTPRDKLIWDVGHQAYAHKILTGRKEAFPSLRQPGGLSGFTKRDESEYDPFGTGHSSTSISAAVGFAEAAKLNSSDEYAIAVIGDGALTGGLAHEALNNIKKDLRLVVILNDNEMSISASTGRFSKYLSKIRATPGYHNTKKATRDFLLRIPLIGKGLFKAVLGVKKAFKNLFYKSNFFEDLGLYYLGPVDGHDYNSLKNVLLAAKAHKGACLVHVRTVKGKGYAPAESSPDIYHGVNPAAHQRPECNFSAKMGEILCKHAESNRDICAITAAMKDGCGLAAFSKKYPERFFDVGIAEEHAAVFAAGLAAAGKRPVFAVYSSFLQRGYDNILHDIALQKLPVTVCIDRAGLSASDGPTHNGIFDVSFLCHTPGVTLYAPVSYANLEKSMELSLSAPSPCFIRYPNSDEITVSDTFVYSKGSFFSKDFEDSSSYDCFIITYGRLITEVTVAKNTLESLGIHCGVILLEKLLPLDEPLKFIEDALQKAKSNAPVLFAEEGIQNGGLAACLFTRLAPLDIMKKREYLIKAIDNSFGKTVKGQKAYCSCGISGADIAASLLHALGKDK